MNSIQELSQSMLVRFTQIDYSREIALIAVTETHGHKAESKEIEVGVARYATNPDGESCEFAIVIADDMHGKGLGSKLMTVLMNSARERDLKVMQGEVLGQNNHMLKLMKNLNFTIEPSKEDDSIKTVYKLL
jgi:acetyltransferase